MKYEPGPSPSKLEHVLEFLARELRRIAGHTHDEPYWEDLRSPASAVNPPGLTSDPTWDATKGGWLYGDALPKELHIFQQLPHAWREGTNLRPHVHWEKATSATGNVVWQIAYQWLCIGQARTAEVTLSASDAVAYTAGADFHMLTPLGEITASAGIGISDVLFIRLTRDVGDAADDYSANARMVEFDTHHQVDAPGSVFLYRKR